MVILPRSDLRDVVAGFLILLLTLAGVARGSASGVGEPDPRIVVAGIVAPICHTDRTAPGRAPPSRPADPDCCSTCALLAVAVLPDEPQPLRLAARPIPVSRIAAVVQAPDTDRVGSPRQAQAPPAA